MASDTKRHEMQLEEGLLPVVTDEKRTLLTDSYPGSGYRGSTPSNPERTKSRMSTIRRVLITGMVFLFVGFGLTSVVSTHLRCSRHHNHAGDQRTLPHTEGSELSEPAGSNQPDLLHRLLHAYFPKTFQDGVYPSDKDALSAVEAGDAGLAAALAQLAKRQDGNDTETPTPTPTPTPSDTASEPSNPASSTQPPASSTEGETTTAPPPATTTQPPAPPPSSTDQPPPPASSTESSQEPAPPPSSSGPAPESSTTTTTAAESSDSGTSQAEESSTPSPSSEPPISTSTSLIRTSRTPSPSSSPSPTTRSSRETSPTVVITRSSDTTTEQSTTTTTGRTTRSSPSDSSEVVTTRTTTDADGDIVFVTETSYVGVNPTSPATTGSGGNPDLQNAASRIGSGALGMLGLVAAGAAFLI